MNLSLGFTRKQIKERTCNGIINGIYCICLVTITFVENITVHNDGLLSVILVHNGKKRSYPSFSQGGGNGSNMYLIYNVIFFLPQYYCLLGPF